MKVIKLQLEDFECLNFSVVGLISNYIDYKLVYALNKELDFAFFNRIENLDILVNKNKFSYITYETYDCQIDASIFLLKNKPDNILNNVLTSNNKENFQHLFSQSQLLVPELKNYDYILKIDEAFKLDLILDFLKYSNKIQFHQRIQVNKTKTIRNLIF
ncbi:MAG: IPExxxVDY family protein [Solirubrobacteraceae bacterium]